MQDIAQASAATHLGMFEHVGNVVVPKKRVEHFDHDPAPSARTHNRKPCSTRFFRNVSTFWSTSACLCLQVRISAILLVCYRRQ